MLDTLIKHDIISFRIFLFFRILNNLGILFILLFYLSRKLNNLGFIFIYNFKLI